MDPDSLWKRMKENYEDRARYKLTRRTPVIMRLDGRAFHTLTKDFKKPFDDDFMKCMNITALDLVRNIQNAKCAYIQSDEISILLIDYDTHTTESWFDNNIQKMTSISASIASVHFNLYIRDYDPLAKGYFDSRVFNIPKEEVCNYFIWRQKDWLRNSILMMAQAHFSHKKLKNKSLSDIHEMLHTKNLNWADLNSLYKNGTFIYRDIDSHDWTFDTTIFTENRNSIEQYVYIGE